MQTFVTDDVNNTGYNCVGDLNCSDLGPDLFWWVCICCLQLQPPWWWRFFQTRSTCPRMAQSLSGVRCPAVLHTISTGPERMDDPSPAVPRDADRVRHTCLAVLHYIQGSDLMTSVHRLHMVSTCKPVCDHLLLVCVCRGRVVLPQCPAKRCRRLCLYLPRSAQHQ